MTQTVESHAATRRRSIGVTPSRVDPAKPFAPGQELERFGHWVGEPIWAPPMGTSREMAETMLRCSRPFSTREARWATVVEHHRSEFTQVREIDLERASIRLPQGKFFVSVTDQANFNTIEEEIPACVQTRLDEFLEGPGRRRGVKVSYLKPLCVELGDEMILTTRKDLMKAIRRIEDEVFEEYRSLAVLWRLRDALLAAVNVGLAAPRVAVEYVHRRRQKAIDAYHARLEFKRRKTALRAAQTYRKYRTSPCTFGDMLALTNPLKQADVIEQYGVENELSREKRNHLLRVAAGSAPWFVTLSLVAVEIAKLSLLATSSVAACDPVFVAEMPEAPGVLLKIGHFDEVGGVMHIEI